jgi:HEAT repeat protein
LDAAPPLEDRVFDPDPEVRSQALSQLATCREDVAEDVLSPALADECPDVVIAAAESLAARRAPHAADALTECIDSRPELAGPLALVLAQLGAAGVEDLLWVCAESADAETKTALLTAIGACGGARSVAPLLALCASEDAAIRAEALAALAFIRERAPHLVDPRAIPPGRTRDIAALLASADARHRLAGLRLAGGPAAGDLVHPLLDRVSDSDAGVRIRALDAAAALASGQDAAVLAALPGRPADAIAAVLDRIERLGEGEARGPFGALLAHEDARVRAAAAALAGRTGARGFATVVARLLDDADGHVRAEACTALGRMGGAAPPRLAELLRDPYPDVRDAALEALRGTARAGGRVPAVEPPARGLPPGPRATLVRACDPACAPGALEEALGDPDAGVRIAALENLHDRGLWLEEAAALLCDEDPRVRARAIRVRLAARPVPPLGPVAPLLRDADPGVRLALAAGLAGVPEGEALEMLLALRRDPCDAVARAAARALGRRPAEESLHALLDTLSSAPLPVRRAAIDALGAIRDAEALPRLRAVARGGEAPLREAAAAAVRRIERVTR